MSEFRSSKIGRNVLITVIVILVLVLSVAYYTGLTPFQVATSSSSTTSTISVASQTFTTHSTSIRTLAKTTSSSSVSTVTLTALPANQNCSSDSQSGNNLSWTGIFGNGTMNMLVIAVNSGSTASLCILYSQNPEDPTSAVNTSAYVTNNYPLQNEPTPGVSAAAQPNYLNFGSSSSNQQFFVKVTISVSNSSSGYYLLGIWGLCQSAALVVNQNPSQISASDYSSGHLYEASCGPLYGAVGQLVGLNGVSYGYANVPMSPPVD